MRRWVTVTTVAMVVVAMAVPTAGAAPSAERAMWLWHGPVTHALDFAQAKAVDRVYVHAAPGFSSDTRYTGFLADAQARGIAVTAMAGDPTWADANRGDLLAWVDEVVAHGGFDAIVLDVEPYLLDEWNGTSRERRRLMNRFVGSLRQARKAAGALPLSAAVPFWFDDPAHEHPRKGPLLDRVVAATDGIVVMAYRDHAEGVDGILDLAGNELDVAAARGRQAVVGVELSDTGLDKLDFAGEGEAALERELAIVESVVGDHPAFGGFALHHYGSYTLLGP